MSPSTTLPISRCDAINATLHPYSIQAMSPHVSLPTSHTYAHIRYSVVGVQPPSSRSHGLGCPRRVLPPTATGALFVALPPYLL